MFPLRDSVRSRTFPFVNLAFIALNFFFFTKEIQLTEEGALEKFIGLYGLIPSKFLADPVGNISNVFSSMFLHGGWGHIIGNMWFLFVFGDNIEDNMGHVRYFFYYLLMGVGAALAQVFAHPNSTLPMVGASGAIAGILGSYIVLYPHARILTFFIFIFFVRLIEIPAFFFLGYWFLIQALNSAGSLTPAVRGEVGGVAWWAHAGGFVVGFIGIFLFKKRRLSYL